MVAEGLGCFGPDKNDARLYSTETSATPTGLSFPTTTDDAAAPPDGDRWLKLLDTFSGPTFVIVPGVTNGQPSVKAKNWVCERGARIRGTLGSGDVSRYLTINLNGGSLFLYIEWVQVSASTFNWRLTKGAGRTTLATGTTAFSTNTTYALRLQLDGTNATLWVNGSQEIQTAFTEKWASTSDVSAFAPENSGHQHYYSRVLKSHGDSEADRPSTDVEIVTLEENGDYTTDQGFGDDANCNAGQTGAVAADVALDGSDQVITSSYWCEHASEGGRQGIELTTATFPSGKDPMVLTTRCVGRANVGLKTMSTNIRSSDGTSVISKLHVNLSDTNFKGIFQHFQNAPDGGVWTQTDLDAEKLSIESTGTNGANDEWAAIIAEMCWVSADPVVDSRGDERRLLMAGVVS